MKLRIQDNSLRLRLTRTEVETLDTQGEVSVATAFPGRRALHYAVKTSDSASDSASGSERVAARFDDRAIVVTIPRGEVREWANGDRVSIHGTEPLSDGGSLAILVEKDFACLKPRAGEDESDMFPHPDDDRETC